jgi:hypothetical protein
MSANAVDRAGSIDPRQRKPEAVPKLVRNTPPGFDWGFYSAEDPRMHLQTLPAGAEQYKVWLEEGGGRAFVPEGRVPAKVLHALRNALDKDPLLAWKVRARWVRQMIEKDWLRLELRGHVARLVAYPGTHHEFTRDIDMRRHASPQRYAGTADVRLDAETAALEIDAQRAEDEWVLVNLAEELWIAE